MFGRKKGTKQTESDLPLMDLDLLIALLGQSIETWRFQTSPKPFARAKYADLCRDCSLAPVGESTFSKAWKQFNESAQLQFGLALSALETESSATALRQLGSAQQGLDRLTSLTVEQNQLTLDVVNDSDVRLEELARHFCAKFKLPIKGESLKASAKRLYEIDFGRLMREADQAKSSAEERMAYLRKLQEEQEETRRPRRGKW